MGLFTKTKSQSATKCGKCGSELHDSNRLERHMKIAHDKKMKSVETVDVNFVTRKNYENIKRNVNNYSQETMLLVSH